MDSEKPKNPAAIVDELEKKIDAQYADRPDPEQGQGEAAEDANPGAADNEANAVEPPD